MHILVSVQIGYFDLNAIVQLKRITNLAQFHSVIIKTINDRFFDVNIVSLVFFVDKLSDNQGEKSFQAECRCRNGGKCYSNANNEKICQCVHGFTGSFCEISICKMHPAKDFVTLSNSSCFSNSNQFWPGEMQSIIMSKWCNMSRTRIKHCVRL